MRLPSCFIYASCFSSRDKYFIPVSISPPDAPDFRKQKTPSCDGALCQRYLALLIKKERSKVVCDPFLLTTLL